MPSIFTVRNGQRETTFRIDALSPSFLWKKMKSKSPTETLIHICKNMKSHEIRAQEGRLTQWNCCGYDQPWNY